MYLALEILRQHVFIFIILSVCVCVSWIVPSARFQMTGGGTYPFGGWRFFSTWVKMHSVL
jgi:hypothetical protein